MKIRFMDVARQFKTLEPEIMREVRRVFTGGRVLQGEKTAELEERLSGLHGLAHGVAVTSLSFVASASAIVQAGFVPVFLDVDDYYLTKEEQVLELIRKSKICAFVAVHIYGQMMELEEIYRQAKKRGVFVIEDAAQALGASRRGNLPGRHSDAVCLSFDPTKVINAYGSGGMILTSNPGIERMTRMLRYHGQSKNRTYEIPGFNSQMDEVQAALLLIKLKYLKKWEKRRQSIAEFYTEAFRDHAMAPPIKEENSHIFHKYVLRVGARKRDRLIRFLNGEGIQTAVHYPRPLYRQPALERFVPGPGLSGVEKIIPELISLPIYPELKDAEIEYIASKTKKFIMRKG